MIALLLCLMMILALGETGASEIPIIDAHSQVDHLVDLRKVVELADHGEVSQIILSTRGRITPEELLSFAAQFPARIIPAVRTKGNAYTGNQRGYYQQLKKQMSTGRFGAMAEVLMYHAQKGAPGKRVFAPEVVAYPDDERVQAALKYALDKKWPFVAHIEFRAIRSSRQREEFMTKLKVLLAGNPEQPFLLIHMGQLDPAPAEQLIEAHKNIHFIPSHSNPLTVNKSSEPWTNMFDSSGSRLSADWKRIVVRHPERFVLGFDNVWAEHWSDLYLGQIALWREALRDLPEQVAHAVAHGNAERLWRLPRLKGRG